MELDPALPDALEALTAAGWQVVIASAGCDWYIRHLLANVSSPFTLHANPGRYDPAQGLTMILPTGSAFYSPQTGIDKVAVVRDALAHSTRVAFAGDGPPDLPAAKLVEPELRFARGWLAQALTHAGENFQALTDWTQLAQQLLKRNL
jgi:2-hydroxy-3-keto-5-methylthiopentenyl-1-phosphate phosphatase